MARVLVTGGAGFIGSHLVESLLESGHHVVVVDNLATGSLDNIKPFRELDTFTWVLGDVCDRELVRGLMKEVDIAYHLAASVGVKYIMDHLISSIENNIEGTVSVLEAASEFGVRVLLTSTSEVYGKSADRPSREGDELRMGNTIKSRWSYACSKALDEYLAFAYLHERGLPVTVVRLFNTVGERQSAAYGMVIPTFVRQALLGEPLTIHGSGEQERCYVYVKDVVWALEQLMSSDVAIGEVYNVGSPDIISVDELADVVLDVTQSASQKTYIPYDKAYKKGFDDAQRRQPDISKVHELIGFVPRLDVRQIVERVVELEEAPAMALTVKQRVVS